jgi:hypothetical protein
VELVLKFVQQLLDAVLLHRFERHSIDARSTSVAPDALPCPPQDVTPLDTVIQRMEAATRLLLGCDVQLPLESADFVDGLLPSGVVGRSGLRHALTRNSS